MASERNSVLHILAGLTKNAQVFPESLKLDNILCESNPLIYSGTHGDIYKGSYDGEDVCIKAIYRRWGEEDNRETFSRVSSISILL
jgi:hypothetical protein